ncbi:hydrogenase [Mariprofundus erugo]|uniref:Hydrogenase n=1 Tax=Mariprofundus erugo TaxID=2528639 RepID=A0A5R9GR71_9PROT|nr:hydrogenase [Mariprofundus erugo]TLS68108.1 hydrogenase [Mariprofundus erugo]
MLKLLKQIIMTGDKSEPLPDSDAIELLGEQLHAHIRKHFAGSLAIRAVDAGSCNGCELEIHATGNCYYDLERFGCHFVASPRHADMLLVTGPVTRNMATAVKMTFAAMPQPAFVVAVGDCASGCGVFEPDHYAIAGAVNDIIPVHASIRGCPPEPADIIRGILQVIARRAA